MSASDLEDKEVISKNGSAIGRSTNVIIDTKSWQLTSIEVALEGDVAEELDVKKHFRSTTVPLDIGEVASVGDKILLKSNKDEIFQRLRNEMADKKEN
jgi:sporulation protein YlmC with PRC-barrel domain